MQCHRADHQSSSRVMKATEPLETVAAGSMRGSGAGRAVVHGGATTDALHFGGPCAELEPDGELSLRVQGFTNAVSLCCCGRSARGSMRRLAGFLLLTVADGCLNFALNCVEVS